jgi:hypothetical protein
VGKYDNGYERQDKDFYPTPAWVTEALTEHVDLAGRHVWEPACGDGRMAEALKAAGASSVYATDIEYRGYDYDGKFDFISKAPSPQDFDDAITNPPYGARNKLAEKFIEVGLQRLSPGGLLALLLPNDFDSGRTRRLFFADCPYFAGKIVLTKRINWFPPKPGKPGSMSNHAWFLWRRQEQRLPIICYAPTPEARA